MPLPPNFSLFEKVPVLTKEGKEKAEIVNELVNIDEDDRNEEGVKRQRICE